MTKDSKHAAALRLIRKMLDIAAGYSKEELAAIKTMASSEYPSVVPLIGEYLKLMDRASVDAARPESRSRSILPQTRQESTHLFDLLREKRLFPLNSDLSNFASRVLPSMSRHRFDKMSRGDIAARIIEFLETREPKTRNELEASMREAMKSDAKPSDRRSFLSKWERIIKGIEL